MTASRTVGGDININAMQNILVVDEIIPDEGSRRLALSLLPANVCRTEATGDRICGP